MNIRKITTKTKKKYTFIVVLTSTAKCTVTFASVLERKITVEEERIFSSNFNIIISNKKIVLVMETRTKGQSQV